MNNFEEKSRESYNRKAFDYDNSFEGKFTEAFKNLLLEEISVKSDSMVLDIACGNGTLLKRISDKYFIKGYGVDISENMIESAKTRFPEFDFNVSKCEKTPYQDRMFDIITVCAAYHHFPDVKAFAKEAARLLKPQGRIYIAEVYYPLFLRILLNPFVSMSKAGDVKFYAPKEIIENFKRNGFQFRTFKRDGNIQILGLQKQ
jgi:ubiquinone/menaquinone biosynthesis C-methylase UbiE